MSRIRRNIVKGEIYKRWCLIVIFTSSEHIFGKTLCLRHVDKSLWDIIIDVRWISFNVSYHFCPVLTKIALCVDKFLVKSFRFKIWHSLGSIRAVTCQRTDRHDEANGRFSGPKKKTKRKTVDTRLTRRSYVPVSCIDLIQSLSTAP